MATKATENDEVQDTGTEGPDGPLLDLSDAAVKRMIKLAKKRGYVTYDELNEVLPSDQNSSDQIEDIYAMLSDMGINVVDSEEAEEAPADDAAAEEEGEVGEAAAARGLRCAIPQKEAAAPPAPAGSAVFCATASLFTMCLTTAGKAIPPKRNYCICALTSAAKSSCFFSMPSPSWKRVNSTTFSPPRMSEIVLSGSLTKIC